MDRGSIVRSNNYFDEGNFSLPFSSTQPIRNDFPTKFIIIFIFYLNINRGSIVFERFSNEVYISLNRGSRIDPFDRIIIYEEDFSLPPPNRFEFSNQVSNYIYILFKCGSRIDRFRTIFQPSL